MTLLDRDPEALVADLRPNIVALVVPAIVLVAVVAAVGFFGLRLEGWQRWAALGGGALVVLLAFVLPLWAWASRRYTVTTRRTILRDGMLVRRRREVLHARVLEVVLRRGPLQVVAGSGDVILELGSGHVATIRSVRSPALVQAALTDLMETQRAEREFRRRNTGEQPY